MFGDTGKHARTDFFPFMEREYKIRLASPSQCFMRTGLTLDSPADSKEGGKNTIGLRRRPMTHAALRTIRIG